MTISGNYTPDSYTGDASTVVFPYTFKIFAEGDIEVLLIDTTVTPNTSTTLSLTTHYSLSGVGEASGGNVVMVTPPTADENLMLRYNMSYTQPYDYIENDSFPAATHENAIDRLCVLVRQLGEEVDRSITFSDISSSSATMPEPTAFYLLRWNAAGDDLESVSADDAALSLTITPWAETLIDDVNAAAAWTTLDLATYLASPGDIGGTTPAGGAFTAGTFSSTLGITGEITAAAHVNLSAGADLIGSATSDITFNTNKFTVAGATGNTVVAGTLGVTGLTTLTSGATLGAATHLVLPLHNDAATPTLAFGDGDSGFYEEVDDNFAVAIAGVKTWVMSANAISAGWGAQGPSIRNSSATSTVPVFTFETDTDTGLGWAAADALSLIAGGVEGIRITETAAAIAVDVAGATTIAGDVKITAGNKLGIGITDTIDGEIHIESTGSPAIVLETTGTVDRVWKHFVSGSTGHFYIRDDTGSASRIVLEQGGTGTALTVDASQRLLVGHTTSAYVDGVEAGVQITKTNSSAAISIARFSADANPPSLNFGKSRGATIGTYTILQDNDTLGIIKFAACDGSDLVETPVLLTAEVDDASPAANDIGGAFTISTHPGGGGALTERLRIAASGQITAASTITVLGNVRLNDSNVQLAEEGANILALQAAGGIKLYPAYSGGWVEGVQINSAGNVGIGLTPTASMGGLSIEAGLLTLKETTTPTADATYGKLYTKDDNKLYFQDGAGVEHALLCADEFYGEMYYTGAGSTITINTADEYHAFTGAITGMVDGMTFQAGSLGDITATSTGAGGTVTVTSNGHGLSANEIVTLNGMSDVSYNGIYEVQSADTNTFVINETNTEASETGKWQRGSNLIVSAEAAGDYAGKWSMSASSANANQVFSVSPCVNLTGSPRALSIRKFANTDTGSMGGTGMMTVATGDIIFFMVKNETAANDFTIKQFDMNLQRL